MTINRVDRGYYCEAIVPREGGTGNGRQICGKPAPIQITEGDTDTWHCQTCARRRHPVAMFEFLGREAEERQAEAPKHNEWVGGLPA